MDPGDRMIYKPTMQHTGCLNHNLKAEKLSDILERKNKKNSFDRGEISTYKQEDFANE